MGLATSSLSSPQLIPAVGYYAYQALRRMMDVAGADFIATIRHAATRDAEVIHGRMTARQFHDVVSNWALQSEPFGKASVRSIHASLTNPRHMQAAAYVGTANPSFADSVFNFVCGLSPVTTYRTTNGNSILLREGTNLADETTQRLAMSAEQSAAAIKEFPAALQSIIDAIEAPTPTRAPRGYPDARTAGAIRDDGVFYR